MSEDERGRSSYLDLLVSTLMEHEKNLDNLVGRLEQIYERLSSGKEEGPKAEEIPKAKEEGEAVARQDTLVYMRIKLSRSIDEVVRVLESLKE